MAITQRPKTPVVETEPKPKGLSPQARTYIGVGVLALCLLIGGGIVWFFLFGSSPKKRQVTVDPNQQASALPGGPGIRFTPRQPRDQRGVNKLGDDAWYVRGETGSVRINRNAAAGTYNLNYSLPGGLGLSREQIVLLSGRFRILQDPLMAKDWKVSDDQTAKLKALNIGGTTFRPGASDETAIRQLWDGYLKAGDGPSRVDAQKKLVEKLDTVAKTYQESERKRYGETIDQIKRILTPEQVKAITQ
jgi:hypothetical protein